jgi:hypothetical protein
MEFRSKTPLKKLWNLNLRAYGEDRDGMEVG